MDKKRTWDLYPEMRRPLSHIEKKMKIVQSRPILSIKVDPFDPVVSAIEKIAHSESDNDSDDLINVKHRLRKYVDEAASIEDDHPVNQGHAGVMKTPNPRKLKTLQNSLKHHHGFSEKRVRGVSAVTTRRKDPVDTLQRPHTVAATREMVPLSYEDAVIRNKTVTATPAEVISAKQSLNTTEPVIFNTLSREEFGPNNGEICQKLCKEGYKIITDHYMTKGFGGRDTPITSIAFSTEKSPVIEETLSYEDVLSIVLQSQASTQLKSRADDQNSYVNESLENKIYEAKPRDRQRPSSNPNHANLVRSALRSAMRRQVSMPSYAIVSTTEPYAILEQNEYPGDGEIQALVMARYIDKKTRVKNPVKPTLTQVYKRSGTVMSPTISKNGVQGKKEYVKLTLPLREIIGYAETAPQQNKAPGMRGHKSTSAKSHRTDTEQNKHSNNTRKESSDMETAESLYDGDIRIHHQSLASSVSNHSPRDHDDASAIEKQQQDKEPELGEQEKVTECLAAMQIRVHNELLKTLKETQAFLFDAEQKRKKRRSRNSRYDEQIPKEPEKLIDCMEITVLQDSNMAQKPYQISHNVKRSNPKTNAQESKQTVTNDRSKMSQRAASDRDLSGAEPANQVISVRFTLSDLKTSNTDAIGRIEQQ